MTAFDALWNYDDPAATAAAFEALLPEFERTGGAPYLELLTQLARTHSLRREFAAAHALLDTVAARMAPDPPRVRIRYLLERGRSFNSAGQRELARPLFVEAWELGRSAGEDALAVDAAHMAAITESGPAALRWTETALALAERSADPKAGAWRGSLYLNLGWTYHGMERYGDALDRFKRALAYRESRGDPRAIRAARWCIGRCLRSLARADEALAIQHTLRAECEAAAEPDPYVDEEIAECLLALGRREESRAAFARAHVALASIAERDGVPPARLERLKSLAA